MGEAVSQNEMARRAAALEAAILMQKQLAEQMPSHASDDDAKFLDWINRYGASFREVVNDDPELSERMANGEVRSEDLVVIRDRLAEYDTGAEDHDAEEPEFDA